MRLLITLLLILTNFATVGNAQEDVPAATESVINFDEFVSVTLDEFGLTSFVISVPRTGTVQPAFFGETELQNIVVDIIPFVHLGDYQPNPRILLHNRVLNAGEYRINISGNPNAQLQLRLSLEPALDIYEPNDTLETATKVTVPFTGLIDVLGSSDDWFRVDVPKNQIVGAQLHVGEAFGTYFIGFFDEAGSLLYLTDDEPWGTDGMRYFKSDGSPLYIKVFEASGVTLYDPQPLILLEIQSFTPNVNSRNTFVKIAMGANDRASAQIDFVSEAAGTYVANAEESIDITEELTRAVNQPNATGRGWMLWGFLGLSLLAVSAGMLVFLRKPKAAEQDL